MGVTSVTRAAYVTVGTTWFGNEALRGLWGDSRRLPKLTPPLLRAPGRHGKEKTHTHTKMAWQEAAAFAAAHGAPAANNANTDAAANNATAAAANNATAAAAENNATAAAALQALVQTLVGFEETTAFAALHIAAAANNANNANNAAATALQILDHTSDTVLHAQDHPSAFHWTAAANMSSNDVSGPDYDPRHTYSNDPNEDAETPSTSPPVGPRYMHLHRQQLLFNLDSDVLEKIVHAIGMHDLLAFALTCKSSHNLALCWRDVNAPGSCWLTRATSSVPRLEWAINIMGGFPKKCWFVIAATQGDLAVVQKLYEHGCPWDEHTCASAAEGGHLEILQWARANGCPWDKFTCAYAARAGHLDLLQWARANGCPWDEDTCGLAAEGGHLDLLQWARANGCPWDTLTCAYAANTGHFEILKWARANGCPWDAFTCAYAARAGHLEILQWARARGCPWDEDTCASAAEGGHVDLLQWARANGCPG